MKLTNSQSPNHTKPRLIAHNQIFVALSHLRISLPHSDSMAPGGYHKCIVRQGASRTLSEGKSMVLPYPTLLYFSSFFYILIFTARISSPTLFTYPLVRRGVPKKPAA